MKRQYTGIYLGGNFVAAARVAGKKLVAFTKLYLSSLKEEGGKGMLKEDVLWEALINKSLREIKGENDEVFVSLGDRGFIFRCFDMPMMKKKEIDSAIRYEIEKYIPFKIEELMWDYSYSKLPQHKNINLSFVGIKNVSFNKFNELFAGLNIKVLSIEPSAIALARVIKSLKDAKGTRSFALLDFLEAESYITFFYNDLPVFNRYLGTFNKEDKITIDRLIEEVRISIQYFKREFRNYDLNKLFILCNPGILGLISYLKKNIDIDSIVLTAEDIVKEKGAELEHLKAYAAATLPLFPAKFKPVFRPLRESIPNKKDMAVTYPSLNYMLVTALAVIGVVGCIFLYSILQNKLSSTGYKFKKEEENIGLSNNMRNEQPQIIEQSIKAQESKIQKLKDAFGRLRVTHGILAKLPYILPKGMWLHNLRLENNNQHKLSLRISGYVFLGNKEQEKNTINNFVSALKKDKDFSNTFTRINIVSIARSKIKSYNVMSFSFILD